MPWFEYVCDKCSARVQRHRPVAYRDAPPRHNEGGCWDGLLVRVAPVRGPGALGWFAAQHRGRIAEGRAAADARDGDDATRQDG